MRYYYVYIVQCSDKSYYIGVTNNVDRRVGEHNEGLDRKSYTYNRRPVKLIKSYYFNDINEAISFEKQFKGWKRSKKELFIKVVFSH